MINTQNVNEYSRVNIESSSKIKLNPFFYMYRSFIWVYQRTLSAQISADCLYSPSCSHFSHQAVAEYGILRGILLTTDRLSRCNRLTAHDIQPNQRNAKTGKVPEDIHDFVIRQKRN